MCVRSGWAKRASGSNGCKKTRRCSTLRNPRHLMARPTSAPCAAWLRGKNMQEKDFSALAPGDSIQHLLTKAIFIVTGNYGDRVTACATADATNPSEWKLVSKHDV